MKTKTRPSSSKSGTGKFSYRPRTSDEVSKRAHQSGGSREGFVKEGFMTWTPKDGDNRIRILPPTWDDAGHFGLEAFAHYQVGADNSSFLCPKKHHGEHCPICEGRLEMMNDGDEEGARALNWRKRVAMWIVDRAEEGKGAQLWFSPWTLDQEIAKQSLDDSGEAVPIDHPTEGYDVTFTREKGSQNQPPKYTGVKIARRPSPLFDDEDDMEKVLEFISENPVPETFLFHDGEYINDVFTGKKKASDAKKPAKGKASKKDEEEEEDEEEDEKPKSKKPSAKPDAKKKAKDEEEEEDEEEDEEEEATWESIHAMNQRQLTEFAEEKEIDFGDEEFDDLKAVQAYICEALDIEKPKSKKTSSAKPAAGKPKFGVKKKAKEEEEEEEDEEEEEEEKPKKSTASWKDKLKKFKK